KFRDPDVTAGNEARAKVPLLALKTLWFNTGTLCNITCRNCYIESSPALLDEGRRGREYELIDLSNASMDDRRVVFVLVFLIQLTSLRRRSALACFRRHLSNSRSIHRGSCAWVVYNIPPDTKSLPENAGKARLPQGALLGPNDFKKTGFGGPCPPI